jgi:hypothetical protein
MSKERLTLFICANMDGETEQPVVTGKAACARPFRHLDRNSLPVFWRFNKKAWMTSSVLEEWLHSFTGRVASFFYWKSGFILLLEEWLHSFNGRVASFFYWKSGFILLLEEWLHSFTGRMMREGRNVILFLDNATCHPRTDLSNVKLVSSPPPQHNFSYAICGSGCNLHTEIIL